MLSFGSVYLGVRPYGTLSSLILSAQKSVHMTFCPRRIVFTIGSVNSGFCPRWVLSSWKSVQPGAWLLGIRLLGSLAAWHSAHVGLCPLMVLSTPDSAYIWFCQLGIMFMKVFFYLRSCTLGNLSNWVLDYLDSVQLIVCPSDSQST